ncbi:hypothetical protein V6N11_076256 [Hibiscus sabdariffa]|uniref:Uncharacterized protein n=1 Tax=Hibiscus sabdariffa TaxID=183260 RepID=A0ABR2Q5R0_9ROSI
MSLAHIDFSTNDKACSIANSFADAASLEPIDLENSISTSPLWFLRIPPIHVGPKLPATAPSVLNLTEPNGGGTQTNRELPNFGGREPDQRAGFMMRSVRVPPVSRNLERIHQPALSISKSSKSQALNAFPLKITLFLWSQRDQVIAKNPKFHNGATLGEGQHPNKLSKNVIPSSGSATWTSQLRHQLVQISQEHLQAKKKCSIDSSPSKQKQHDNDAKPFTPLFANSTLVGSRARNSFHTKHFTLK